MRNSRTPSGTRSARGPAGANRFRFRPPCRNGGSWCGGSTGASGGGSRGGRPNARDDPDAQIEDARRNTIGTAVSRVETFQISSALQETWELVRAVNQYIVKREPWSLAKRPDARPVLDGTLYRAADALRVTAALIDPVMPQAAERIRGMLGIAQERWPGLRLGTLTSGTRLGETAALFPRIEKTVEELRGMTSPENSAAEAPTQDPRISIEDFMKVQLRVAKVLEAEAVPKSKKLLKLKVDTGADQDRKSTRLNSSH